MIAETIRQIRNKIDRSSAIKEESKKELLDLLSTLESEIEQLPDSDQDQVESIVGFAQASAHEATRAETRPQLHQMSLDALAESVRGWEKSHPELVKVVNSICTALSNVGV